MGAEKLKKQKTNLDIPLVGFGTEVENDLIKTTYDEILKEEKIRLPDFVIRKIPNLSTEGAMRSLFVEPSKLKLGTLEDDDLNLGKKKCLIKFYLPKGSYATNLIKYIVK